jgi:hypothetical protein
MSLPFKISKIQIYKELAPIFKKYGFEPLPEMWQFRQKTERGFNCFILSIQTYDHEAIVELHLGSRINIVEDFALKYMQLLKEFGPNAMTMIISEGRFKEKRFLRHHIKDEVELVLLKSQFEVFVQEQALPSLELWQDIENLNTIFNEDPLENQFFYNQYYRAIRGLILNRFVGDERYVILKEMYQEVLSKLDISDHQNAAFDKLTLILDGYHPN